MRRRLAWLALCALPIWPAAACHRSQARTQIMLAIDAESGVRQRAAQLSLQVFGGPREGAEDETLRHDQMHAVAPRRWPLEFALVPEGGDTRRRYRVVAEALDAHGASIGTVRAIGGYVAGETRALRLLLEDACIERAGGCEPDETCREGDCVDARVDATDLPRYSGPEDAGPAAEIDGGADSGTSAAGRGAGSDAATLDAAPTGCGGDAACDDGVFCNGAETCEAGSCLPSASDRCLASQRCDEAQRRCISDCSAAPDADGDGQQALECGGDDCDDSLERVFQGAAELCDGLDNDCDQASDEAPADSACRLDHASATCDDGACVLTACSQGYDDCDETAETGCETALGTIDDCSGCAMACRAPQAVMTCNASRRCVRSGCTTGFVDCDGVDANGCETSGSCSTDPFVEQDFVQSDTPSVDDRFGADVGISGNLAVVGADADSELAMWAGAVYVFRGNAGTWVRETKLSALDAGPLDRFGEDVAIFGNVILVGAKEQLGRTGAAYVFRHDGSQWRQERKFTDPEPAQDRYFGISVALWNDIAVVGAIFPDPGVGYVYRWNGSAWVDDGTLVGPDAVAGIGYGESVAIWDDVVMMGAPGKDDNGEASGSVYVFRYNGSTWAFEQQLTPQGATAYDGFGSSVALHDGVAAIGARGDDTHGGLAGAAYVFRFDGTDWVEEQKLTASDGRSGQELGWDVGVGVNTVIASAPEQGGSATGTVYAYRYNGTTWIEQGMHVGAEATGGGWFGQRLDISGNTFIASAINSSSGATPGAWFFGD